MATIESNAIQIAAINTFLNSLTSQAKLPSELAAQTDITDSSEVSILQKGTDDAKGIATDILRGYKGTWAASTNTPTLIDGTGINLDTYKVSVAGSQDLGSGSISFVIGDFIKYADSVWTKVANTSGSFITENTNQLSGLTGNKKLDGDWEYNKTDIQIDALGELSMLNKRYGDENYMSQNLLSYQYEADTSGDTSPADGKITWNQTTQINSTKLYVSFTDREGNDIKEIVQDVVTIGSSIYVQQRTNADNFQRWQIVGSVDMGDWSEIDVELISGTAQFGNQLQLLITVQVGGGSFITKDTNQLSGLTGDKKWDGEHTFSTLNNSVVLKSPSGKEVIYNPTTDSNSDRGTMLAQVITDFTDGDLIIVGTGVYDTRIELSDNLNILFLNGAKVIYTGAGNNLIFNTGNNDFIVNITGFGHFQYSGSGVNTAILITDSTTLNIKGKNLISSGICINTLSGVGSGAVITSTFDYYESNDGTFDSVIGNSTMNLYGNYALSITNYVLENDGGTINCFIKKIESLASKAVFSGVGVNNIYDTLIIAPAGEQAIEDGVVTNLFDCKIFSDVAVFETSQTAFTGYYYDIFNNKNITSGSYVNSTNVLYINKASDFPTAVGGVIELAPTPGIELTYILGANDIDVGSDEFMNTGGDIVIIGSHRTASGITSTTSNTLFTSVDGFLALEFIGVTAPNAKIIDFSTPVATFKSFVVNNFIVRDCDTIGTISGAFTTSLRTMTVINATSGGLLWTGTDGSQINISRFLSLAGGGTLLDLGTATFDIINISSDNRFLSDVGSTVLSGLPNSGNLKAGGRATVSDSLFNGLGTALSGIDTLDLQWNFDQSNTFVDNSTKNTEVITDAFLTSSETVTISSIGVFVAVGGSNWASDITKRFTVATDGLITYIGLETIDIIVGVNSTVEKVGGGSDTICTKIAINGTVSEKTIGCTENATPTGVTSTGIFEIETGDTIQLFVGNEGSTSNIIVSTCNLIVNER